MLDDAKIEQMATMLGCECDASLFKIYLLQAKEKILNRRFPYGSQGKEVEPIYDQLQIELAVCLYNLRGAEGQSSHNENGVSRSWRSENEILQEVVPYAGVPNL